MLRANGNLLRTHLNFNQQPINQGMNVIKPRKTNLKPPWSSNTVFNNGSNLTCPLHDQAQGKSSPMQSIQGHRYEGGSTAPFT